MGVLSLTQMLVANQTPGANPMVGVNLPDRQV
jgi:hypothetical protein